MLFSISLDCGFFLTCRSRYNLKRRVASLPPLSSEIFAEKVLTAQASSSAEAAKASFEKLCTACQRTYYSENAYQNHLGSQKHRLRISALQTGAGAAKDDETSSVLSSTISLGEPISLGPKETIDPEAEAEFSKVVNGIKDTKIDDSGPVSSRPSRPHHSAAEVRSEHPLSQPPAADSVTPADSATPDVESESKVLLNRCLFCNYDSPSLKLSVMHMTKFHGLFIPEQPYLVDLEGLVGYLYQKINVLHECLYCHKFKGSVSGIQTHMRDKGHCMIAFESEEEMIEVGQFYDFRSSYSDAEDDDEDNNEMEGVKETSSGDVKIGAQGSKPLKTVISSSNGDEEMDDGDENAEGWETDSSASSLDSEDLTAVPIDHSHAFQRLPLHRHHSLTDPRPHRTVDGFHSHAHSHHAVFRSEYELHLPSGRTAGHRSLSRYYRQNLHSYPTPAERIETRILESAAHSSGDEMMMDNNDRGRALTTRANGGTGMLGVTDAKKREIQIVEKRERKREHRARKQFEWGVNKQGNNQKHFRDPLLQ